MAVLPVAEDLVLPLIERYELRFHIIEVIIIIIHLIQMMVIMAFLRVQQQLSIIAIVQDTIYTKFKVGQSSTYFERGRFPFSSC